MNSRSIRQYFFWAVIVLLGAATPSLKADVVTYIDLLTTTQTVSALNSTNTSTVAATNALGGFRTFSLSSIDNDPDLGNTIMRVSTNAPIGPRFSLSTPTDATSSFSITWGGAGGTNGLGGVDFFGGFGAPGISGLTNSFLSFSLRSADLASSFTWTFTDTINNVASYTGSFPTHSSTNPAIAYAISLASFSGAGTIDWTSINFITLSGGGLELDLSLASPIYVTTPVPEPGTWAAAGLLLLTAIYIRWRRSRTATAVETPAAA